MYGGEELNSEEIAKFKSAMLVVFAEMDWEKGWTQQSHYGTITSFFSIFYAISMLFAGRFVEWIGSKKGFL